MRFLFAWHHVAPGSRVAGLDGVRAVVARLDGFELAADAWERHVLPARVDGYDPSMLDLMCFSGETAWGRVSTPPRPNPSNPLPPRPIRATPIAVFLRDHAAAWRTLAAAGRDDAPAPVMSAAGAGGARLVVGSWRVVRARDRGGAVADAHRCSRCARRIGVGRARGVRRLRGVADDVVGRGASGDDLVPAARARRRTGGRGRPVVARARARRSRCRSRRRRRGLRRRAADALRHRLPPLDDP